MTVLLTTGFILEIDFCNVVCWVEPINESVVDPWRNEWELFSYMSVSFSISYTFKVHNPKWKKQNKQANNKQRERIEK